MDMAENLPFLLMFGMIIGTGFIPQFLPDAWKIAFSGIQLIGLLIIMGGMEVVVRLTHEECEHLGVLVVDPRIKGRKTVFVTKRKSEYLGMTADGKPMFNTHLQTKHKFKYPDFNAVHDIYVRHCLTWEERVNYTSAQCQYAGTRFKHPKTDYPVWWLYPQPYEDHGELYPQFTMEYGGGDYPLTNVLAFNQDGSLLQEHRINVGGTLQESDATIMRGTRAQLEAEVWNLRSEVSMLKQKIIRYEEIMRGLRSEIAGLIKAQTDNMKQAMQLVLGLLAAKGTIENVLKHLRGRQYPLHIIMMTIIVVSLIGATAVNSQWVTEAGVYFSNPQNQLFVGFSLMGILCIGYLTLRWRKNKMG